MRRKLTIFWLILAWIALFWGHDTRAQIPPPLPGTIQMAASSLTLSQSVTVTVQEINELSISGDVTLTIATASPGTGPDPVNNVSASYNLTTNGSNKKIIGAIDVAYSAGLSLSALLTAPSGGSASIQTLSTTAKDLASGFGLTAETGLTISYTATATINVPPNGLGETRTVTLTLMDN